MLLEEGLDHVFHRHRLIAEAVRRAVGVWADGGALEFNIVEAAERAASVTTILIDDPPGPGRLLKYCEENCGVVLGVGIGELEGKAFRIAHMGHVNAPMILGTLGATEMGLVALGVANAKGGVQAAIDYLARSVPA